MSPSTSSGNKGKGVVHALRGAHRPRDGGEDAAAERLENLVERSQHEHEAQVGMSDVGGLRTKKGDATTLDRLSRYFKSLGCGIIPTESEIHDEFASWKMGNYIAVRNGEPGETFFESMPLYVRVGMHLLFYGSKQRSLLRFGTVETVLKKMSLREGEIYDDNSKPADVQAFIRNFIATYNVDTHDLLETDLTRYATRNAFFYRKLRPDVRPIAEPNNERVIGSAADCRLMVFDSAAEAKQIWIKGRAFSVQALINKAGSANNKLSENSSIAVYRLAPADYHRYHHPVGPVKVTAKEHAGQEYYTVNPDAVNEDFDVFTGNTRDITMLAWTPQKEMPALPIAFISIGAMLVGSNRFTNAKLNSKYTRGQEMGYFAYGGSTCIALFPPKAKVKWDADLKANSANGIETLVNVNERIGVSDA